MNCSPAFSKCVIRWPGLLDYLASGGCPAGHSPWETVLNECDEEAALDANFVRARAEAPIQLYCLSRTTEDGFLEHHTEPCQ